MAKQRDHVPNLRSSTTTSSLSITRKDVGVPTLSRKAEAIKRQQKMKERLAEFQIKKEREIAKFKAAREMLAKAKLENVERVRQMKEKRRLETLQKILDRDKRAEDIVKERQRLAIEGRNHAIEISKRLLKTLESKKNSYRREKKSKELNSASRIHDCATLEDTATLDNDEFGEDWFDKLTAQNEKGEVDEMSSMEMSYIYDELPKRKNEASESQEINLDISPCNDETTMLDSMEKSCLHESFSNEENEKREQQKSDSNKMPLSHSIESDSIETVKNNIAFKSSLSRMIDAPLSFVLDQVSQLQNKVVELEEAINEKNNEIADLHEKVVNWKTTSFCIIVTLTLLLYNSGVYDRTKINQSSGDMAKFMKSFPPHLIKCFKI